MSSFSTLTPFPASRLDDQSMHDYVAQLQLHMTLQARHLIPGLHQPTVNDTRLQLLHQTQADLEKLASRQWL